MGIFSLAGVKVAHNKNTSAMRAVRIDRCESVTLPMKQHIGAPCAPCVKQGDAVLAGQLVGEAVAPVSAPVHASISGTVQKPEVIRLPSGEDVQAVVIKSDGEMRRIETAAPQVRSLDEFIAAVRDSGLVGLGGAGFPASVKLRSAAQAGADILLVNAAECEPYITADHREALDNAGDLMEGIGHICKWLGIRQAVIGVEDNKGDAISLLRNMCAEQSAPGLKLRVAALPSRYPQGAEKVFIHSLTGRVVPLGKLPPDVGVLTMNIASVAFLGRYMRTGVPLISRTVTVDGGAAPRPMNVRAPIGIKLEELCAFCGLEEKPAKIILGGPMMGAAAPDLNAIISKCSNAVLLFNREQAAPKPETACIRCGACVFGCPMRLQPFKLAQAYAARDARALEDLCVNGCMECGSCSYACPAGRELVQGIRMGKQVLRGAEQRAREAAKS
ncbi:MAG: electron transport complex subunit RsxC [Oscillospiraceae bacterium]|nr:electron transport complex subunit RsxC [Oscillospiraceae bacterium]